MAGKRDKPEDVVLKLRQVEVLHGQGTANSDAVRQIGVTEPMSYRWRKQYGGMNHDQLKRLKELETENQPCAISPTPAAPAHGLGCPWLPRPDPTRPNAL